MKLEGKYDDQGNILFDDKIIKEIVEYFSEGFSAAIIDHCMDIDDDHMTNYFNYKIISDYVSTKIDEFVRLRDFKNSKLKPDDLDGELDKIHTEGGMHMFIQLHATYPKNYKKIEFTS